MALIRHLATLRPGLLISTTASAKISLRAIARRWLVLNEEIKGLDAYLEQLTQHAAPALVEAHGIKANTAAEMLLIVGDNPDGFVRRRPWPSSAVLAPSQHPVAGRVGTASIAAGIDRPMLLSIAS